jgi:hypothetical protein
MYDVNKLSSLAECRTVMQRARDRNVPEVYKAVFRRMCELVGSRNDDPSDPLVREFYETLAAYEQLLTEKNGRTTAASRTRQKISNKGVYQSLIEWTRGKVETNGFKLLVEAGLPEYTGEYLVARYASRFPADIVTLACDSLVSNNISPPDPLQAPL